MATNRDKTTLQIVDITIIYSDKIAHIEKDFMEIQDIT
jgi:hypothetical protein